MDERTDGADWVRPVSDLPGADRAPDKGVGEIEKMLFSAGRSSALAGSRQKADIMPRSRVGAQADPTSYFSMARSIRKPELGTFIDVYRLYSDDLDGGTSVLTASASPIFSDLSRISTASSICSSVMIKGGAITSVSYQGAR